MPVILETWMRSLFDTSQATAHSDDLEGKAGSTTVDYYARVRSL
jgi:hypothetical protein